MIEQACFKTYNSILREIILLNNCRSLLLNESQKIAIGTKSNINGTEGGVPQSDCKCHFSLGTFKSKKVDYIIQSEAIFDFSLSRF